MSEDTVAPAVLTDSQPAQNGDTAPDTNAGQPAPEAKFTQADIDRIINDRLAKERKRAEEAAARATAEAERKAAEEQGKFQELYQQTQAKLQAAEERQRQLEQAALRRDVAAKLNLPAGLADRIRGETADEIEADAKALLAAIPKPAAPNINAGAPAGNAPAPVMSDDERKRRAAALGVDWRYFEP